MPRSTAKPPASQFLPLSAPALHVLLALAAGDRHGWAIIKDVERETQGNIQLSVGTLYGLIKRLLQQELIAESAERPPRHWDDQRRRYYRITRLGRQVALAEVERLEKTLAVARRSELFVPQS